MESPKPRIAALIPLRGGSKSIPLKNIKEIAGKPLAYWVLKAATEAPSVDKVFVSTEDARIKEAVEALQLNVSIVDRPHELAGDLVTTDAVILHFFEQHDEFDILITLQATSPLTTSEDIERALAQLNKDENDSMLTGVRVKRFIWNDDGTAHNYDHKNRPMRQQFTGTLIENGAFYITKKEVLAHEKNRLGGKIGIYEMPEDRFLELDEPHDWNKIESMLMARTPQK